MSEEGPPALTTDRVLGGRLVLQQPARGHRAGTDAILLAAAAPEMGAGQVADAGCGVGTVGLAVARRMPGVRVRLLDRDPALCALARDNAAANGLADRVVVDQRDILARAPLEADADLILSNPPFFEPGTMRASPDQGRRTAHLLGTDGANTLPRHGDWLRGLLRLAAPHACVVLIHRSDALPALLEAAAGRLGDLRVRPVVTRAGAPATRILFGGRVGSRAPFTLLPEIALHDGTGAASRIADAVHAGEAVLPLFDALTRKRRPRGPASLKSGH